MRVGLCVAGVLMVMALAILAGVIVIESGRDGYDGS